MTVRLKNPDAIFKLPIKFEGCSRDSELHTENHFPPKYVQLHVSCGLWEVNLIEVTIQL